MLLCSEVKRLEPVIPYLVIRCTVDLETKLDENNIKVRANQPRPVSDYPQQKPFDSSNRLRASSIKSQAPAIILHKPSSGALPLRWCYSYQILRSLPENNSAAD